MKIFGFEIAKAGTLDSMIVKGSLPESEILEGVRQWNWVRNTLIGVYGTAVPQVDPWLLATLFECNGFHANALYWKQAATVGQGYECSDKLHAIIDEANEDDSFQDLLDKSSIDLELYGNMYIEPVIDMKGTYFYHSPALNTRVKPPQTDDPQAQESFVQFIYKKGFGVTVVPYDKFQFGARTGIRQLKLSSPTADPWYGKPEYLSARKTLSLNFNIVTLAEKWFENSMMLDKLLTLSGGKLTPDQKNNIATFMKRTLKGLDNAAKSLILELQRGSTLDVKDMNGSVKDAPYGQMRKDNTDEIAAAHRVPLPLMGITPNGQLGATGLIEGMLKIFKIGFADHRQRKLERFWKKLFRDCNLPDWQTFKLSPMDTKAGESTAQDLNALTTAGILSTQEANMEWMTEKGQFTPAGAMQFTRMLKMIDEGRARL